MRHCIQLCGHDITITATDDTAVQIEELSEETIDEICALVEVGELSSEGEITVHYFDKDEGQHSTKVKWEAINWRDIAGNLYNALAALQTGADNQAELFAQSVTEYEDAQSAIYLDNRNPDQ